MSKTYRCICGKEFSDPQAFNGHKSRCEAHLKNKYGEDFTLKPNGNLSNQGWSKGLTRYTDERVLNMSNSLKRAVQKAKAEGRAWSKGIASTEEAEAERKEKISRAMKQKHCGGIRHGSGRGKKGWYKGFYCRSTYELVYVIYNLDHNIDFTPCTKTYNYVWEDETHKYYPDFELKDGTIVEIKGYMTDRVKVKFDAIKDRPKQLLFRENLDYAFDYVYKNYEFSSLEDLYEDGQANTCPNCGKIIGKYSRFCCKCAPKFRQRKAPKLCPICNTPIKRSANYCSSCAHKKSRKAERPSKENLSILIKEKSFVSIANEYGVSDNAVRKWCKYYGLPYRKRDIKERCQRGLL